MAHPATRLFLIAILFSSTPILAEQKNNAPIPAQQKQKRKVASVPADAVVADARVKPKNPKVMDIKLGITLGLSSISDPESNAQASSNYLVGLFADFKELKYFGAELDAFYGLPKKKDSISSEAYGGMSFLKLQLPIDFDTIKISPKIGGGYGSFTLKESSDFGDKESSDLKGLSVMGGVDVEAFSDFLFSADYAQAIGAKGKLKSESEENPGETDLSDVSFTRIRVGGFYRVTRHVLLGAQYVRRNFRYGITTVEDGGLTLNPVQNQFLLVLLYEL